MEQAASEVVGYLRSAFADPQTGQPAFVRARLYQSAPWTGLPAALRELARAQLPGRIVPRRLRCLALLASDGDEPEWKERQAAGRRQAIPLHGDQLRGLAPILAKVLDAAAPEPPRASQPASGAVGRDGGFRTFYVPEAAGSGSIADQDMVARHSVRSAVAFSGPLPGGESYAVVLLSRVKIPASVVDMFRSIAASTQLALLPCVDAPLFAGERPPAADPAALARARTEALTRLLEVHEETSARQARGLQSALGQVAQQEKELRSRERKLRQEARIIETLYRVGQSLAAELDLDRLVQLATDAATSVVGAEYGTFFYKRPDGDGRSLVRYAVSGEHAEAFADMPTPTATALFGPHFPCAGLLRCADVTEDEQFRETPPYTGLPEGHPQVRSYMAVPVVSPTSGERLGSFYFGHSKPGVFKARDENLVTGIAAHAASAINNARLYRAERRIAFELQRSLLPASPPEIPELDIAFRYLPGMRGERVGGDWFDVIPLAAGRVALVIGDVMGRGVRAAAVMGQLKMAVRAYAVMDLPPAQLMHHLNRLVTSMFREQIATCVYAVYDPGAGSLRWANAGHMPPALIACGAGVRLLDDDLGVPLGAEERAVFDDERREFPAGARLLLYTDGLVETPAMSLSDRLRQLAGALAEQPAPPDAASGEPAEARDAVVDGLSAKAASATSPEPAPVLGGGVADMDATCERLLARMLTGDEHDDVALLLVRALTTVELKAAVALEPSAPSVGRAREFVRDTLAGWGLPDKGGTVTAIVNELVTNAVRHARTSLRLRMRRHPGRIVVEVADRDGRLPKPMAAAPIFSSMYSSAVLEERHRGLLIVSTLASRWGVRPTDDGKVVWAEIAD